MITSTVTIEGMTAFLMHRFGESAEQQSDTRRVKIQNKTPREAAAEVEYRNAAGALYFPGAAISRLLREAGGGHKLRGTRKSAKFIVPSAVLVLDDAVPFLDPANLKKVLKDYEVDSRPVVIPSTKGRIMRHRPRLDMWSARFNVRVNEKLLDVAFVHQLLVEGGEQLGLGDFRPERGGPFGTFRVISWDEQKQQPIAAE